MWNAKLNSQLRFKQQLLLELLLPASIATALPSISFLLLPSNHIIFMQLLQQSITWVASQALASLYQFDRFKFGCLQNPTLSIYLKCAVLTRIGATMLGAKQSLDLLQSTQLLTNVSIPLCLFTFGIRLLYFFNSH